MKKLTLIVWLGLFLPAAALAQSSLERSAQNNIHKGKWDKAKAQLIKALRKDNTNAMASYVFSAYYFSPSNPSFQIDSAYRYVMAAMDHYQLTSAKLRERLKRFPLDSTFLVRRREQIDSAAFERSKRIHTERAYLDFLSRFPLAAQQDQARELRDEVAYVDALKENTYESFLNFLTKYPNASRAKEARERYEKLLFEAKTKDGKLASYELFLEQYPESPYRPEAEVQIFEISTAAGQPSAFLDFIKRYPDSKLFSRARNIVYHLLKEEEKTIPAYVLSDSIKHIRRLEQGYLVPFLKDDRFGFMNAGGREIIRAFAKDLDPHYRCGNIIEDLLVADNKILARDGSVLLAGKNIIEVEDLGHGFVLAVGKDCSTVIHKSGFILEECIQDAHLLAGAFLAVKKNNRWSVKTFAGRLLAVGELEEIFAIDEVIVIRQSGKYRLTRKEEIAKSANRVEPALSRPYDEVKRLNNNSLWVRAGEMQGLVGMDLREKISLSKKEIQPSFFGAVSKSPAGYKLWGPSAGETETFQDVRIQKPWIAVRKNDWWIVLDQNNLKQGSRETFDSIYFAGAYCMCVKGDSLRAYLSPETYIPVPISASVQFLPGRDSTFYLLIEESEKKSVFDFMGNKLFTVNYDRLEFAGDNLFLVVRKDKRGLINLQGKPVTPFEYDAMGAPANGTVPVLKDRKFGFLDLNNRKEIKPQYEKNLIRFSSQYLIAFKNGNYGIIDWENKTVAPFEYEEIRYWNDSTAMVKRNFQWIIYNFVEKRVIADKIRTFKPLRDSEDEKLIIINQENNYGVISSRKGFVLPATYSDIVNLGSPAEPLYFTEKHIEEASIYVVIYYDENGKLLRRQVFEIDDYERIYCSKN